MDFTTFEGLRVFNGTLHEINIYREEDTIPIQDGRKLIKKMGAEPFLTIPPGVALNCTKGSKESPYPQIPFLKGAVVFTGYDPIPDGYDVVIVSNQFRSAVEALAGNTAHLAVVDGAIYADEQAIRPCGCLGLAVG